MQRGLPLLSGTEALDWSGREQTARALFYLVVGRLEEKQPDLRREASLRVSRRGRTLSSVPPRRLFFCLRPERRSRQADFHEVAYSGALSVFSHGHRALKDCVTYSWCASKGGHKWCDCPACESSVRAGESSTATKLGDLERV